LATFRRCRRKWFLQYEEGWKPNTEPSDASALSIGNAFHELMRRFYTNGDFGDYDGESIAGIMAQHYVTWTEETGCDRNLTDFVPERSHLVDDAGSSLLARPDFTARNAETGRMVMIDFKTVSDINQYAEKAPRETQPMHMLLVHLMLTGEMCDFEYRLAKRNKHGARSNPPYYAQVPVYHTKAEIKAYARRMRAERVDIRRVQDVARDRAHPGLYPTPTDDCRYTCEFHAMCPLLDYDPQSADIVLNINYHREDPLAHHAR